MIQADNLTKYYDNRIGVQSLTFSVEPGETVGLLGPKGAGKTTTMRMLTAYLPPSAGTATVASFDIFSQSLEVRKRVGYLPEAPAFYDDMTVSGYLNFLAKLRKLSHRRQRVVETLEMLQLAEKSKTMIGRLTNGWRKRVGLAQAIIHSPEVLILDEPTLRLEPLQIVEMLNLIKRLRRSHTIVISSQALDELEQMCDRLLILDKGYVVAEGTPQRLLTRLEGGHVLRLKTVSAPSEAAEILGSLDGVNGVWSGEVGCFDIECACGADCRAAVAYLAMQHGWGLLELQSVDFSLEDFMIDSTTSPQIVL